MSVCTFVTPKSLMSQVLRHKGGPSVQTAHIAATTRPMNAAPNELSRCSWIGTTGILAVVDGFVVAMGSRLKEGTRLSNLNDNSVLFYEIETDDISGNINVA